jgi:hypothetical protein
MSLRSDALQWLANKAGKKSSNVTVGLKLGFFIATPIELRIVPACCK